MDIDYTKTSCLGLFLLKDSRRNGPMLHCKPMHYKLTQYHILHGHKLTIPESNAQYYFTYQFIVSHDYLLVAQVQTARCLNV